MLRLIANDLADNVSIWLVALLVAAAAAAAAFSVAVGLLETGATAGFEEQLAVAVLASAVLVFSGVAGAVVLGNVTRLTVTLQRRSYALCQLIGVTPLAVVTVVRPQLVVVAAVGSAIGAAVAGPFVPALLDFGLSESSGLQDLRGRFDVGGALWVVAAATVLVWLSGLGPSRTAGRVRAIEVLRDPSPREAGMTWIRWSTAAVALLIAVAMTAGLAGTDVRNRGTSVLLIGPMLTATAAALGPLLFPLVHRAWTRLVPDRVSPSWFLARTTVGYDLSRGSATVSALLVAIALPAASTLGSSRSATRSGS